MLATAEARSFTRNEIYELVWDQPLKNVADEMQLSANGLAKICDRLLIPYPPRGYWRRDKSEREELRPPLPEAPEDQDAITLSEGRASSRRTRTRRPVDARRDQMLDAATALASAQDLNAVTVRSVARDIGISETQGHNYFPTRLDLLVALAQRELAAIEAERVKEVSRGSDITTQVVMSTLAYFRETQKRGPLLQQLVSVPEVRETLRAQRRAERDQSSAPTVAGIMRRSGMSQSLASASNQLMVAVCLRAGRLLAEKRIEMATAERLCLPMVIAAVRSNSEVGMAVRRPR